VVDAVQIFAFQLNYLEEIGRQAIFALVTPAVAVPAVAVPAAITFTG
jgi:hypothetical protein